MPETIRTFIAIPIMPSPSLRGLVRRWAEMAGPVKGVRVEQLHVTLTFLGDTPWNRTIEIGRIISEVAGMQHAFDAVVRGIGAFPNRQRPRVAWAGIEPAEPFVTLAGLLNDLIGELGFPQEERRFHPHVTLARIKGRPPVEFLAELEDRREQEFGGLHVDRLTYYQSELGPEGPVYTPLSEHPLV